MHIASGWVLYQLMLALQAALACVGHSSLPQLVSLHSFENLKLSSDFTFKVVDSDHNKRLWKYFHPIHTMSGPNLQMTCPVQEQGSFTCHDNFRDLINSSSPYHRPNIVFTCCCFSQQHSKEEVNSHDEILRPNKKYPVD